MLRNLDHSKEKTYRREREQPCSDFPAPLDPIKTMNEIANIPLFSYGTLRQANVQMASFGRLLEGTPDCLPGFATVMIRIEDPEVVAKSGAEYHPAVLKTGNAKDEVLGTLFMITEAELAKADEYEVDDYQRVEVTLKSGVKAWVYVKS